MTNNSRNIVVFFIGGAGDKEKFYIGYRSHIVLQCKKYFEKRFETLKSSPNNIIKTLVYGKTCYFGYHEVRMPTPEYAAFFEKHIPSKEHIVYIAGHSLGGWNGAWLTACLADQGYRTRMLVTLDPVGMGIGVSTIANISYLKPEPKAEIWINIHCKPEKYDHTDWIALAGGKWRNWKKSAPAMDIVTDLHHGDALEMFSHAMLFSGRESLCDYMIRDMFGIGVE